MQPETLLSVKILDQAGNKVGEVERVYVDAQTSEPNWVTVATGMFGGKETFIPLQDARDADGDLRVPYDKEFIKDAPRIEAEQELSEDEEAALYNYYGLSFTGGGDAGAAEPSAAPTGQATMTRSEEQLRVGREEVERGRARPRKYVVTEHVTTEVPVRREELRIEREPITTDTGDAAPEQPLEADEQEIVLHEERPVVTTESVPVERVRVATEVVTDHETVGADVRKEEIELDQDATPRR